MSVENPYSDSNIAVKPYFANQGFEPDAEPGPPGELKKLPAGAGAGAGPALRNGAADRTRPALANPYGSIYRSAAGGPGPGPGGEEKEEAERPCPSPCCRRGGCCACCRLCLIS